MSALDLLHISLADQCLYGFAQGRLLLRFSVSTALNGAGEAQDSGCTPRGPHRVEEKIGDGLPSGAVFKARCWTGEVFSPQLQAQWPQRDWILTRILRLTGCQPGFNQGDGVDSFSRYIYLHGTPDSEPMGVPLSHGCVRLRNADLLELFDRVPLHCAVLIDEAPCPTWAAADLR
ncbi:MAG: L,D-transpeptidase [Pseudomonas sp.]|uniref:L,D-transpeptidase n=1 Tax=Pseudomonas sp. TaxID=306 RepID=UPI00339340B2